MTFDVALASHPEDDPGGRWTSAESPRLPLLSHASRHALSSVLCHLVHRAAKWAVVPGWICVPAFCGRLVSPLQTTVYLSI